MRARRCRFCPPPAGPGRLPVGVRSTSNNQQPTPNDHGTHQADSTQVDRRQGAPQAARHQGGAQVGPRHRRRQEAAPLPPGHRRAPRDPPLPEVDGAPDPQAALPAPGARDRAGLQDRPALPVVGRRRAPGGVRGLPRRPLRGHQPVRHPRQARHHHAQGHPAGPPHPWRARVSVRLIQTPVFLNTTLPFPSCFGCGTRAPWAARGVQPVCVVRDAVYI
mmetsp:Transcript_24011/g.71149  ORF Transcript_24011/g.71149 Transcript_24011/m.71149 type:complete len:219 (-) Transcript_24011:47-703(-)